jgi:hypothetical protein
MMETVWDLPYVSFSLEKGDTISLSFGITNERYKELETVLKIVNKKMVADFFREIQNNIQVDQILNKAIEEGQTGGAIPIEGALRFDYSKYLHLIYASPLIKTNRELLFITYMLGRDVERFSNVGSQEMIKAYVAETCDKVLKAHGKEANVGII